MQTISGYTICFDAAARGVEVDLSLRSFLAVCDEVVVVDCNEGESEDGQRLRALAQSEARLRIVHEPVDVDSKSVALELLFARPTRARQECSSATVLSFELGDIAPVGRRDALHDLAESLEFEEGGIDAYALPRAVHDADLLVTDASFASTPPCLSRNDPLFVHDLARARRRFDEAAALRVGVGTAAETRLVRSDNLAPLRYRCVHDPRIGRWIDTAHGVGAAALLARDEVQLRLNAAFDVHPTIVRYLSPRARQQRSAWWSDWWLPRLRDVAAPCALTRLAAAETWNPWLLAAADFTETFLTGTAAELRRPLFLPCGHLPHDDVLDYVRNEAQSEHGAKR